MALSAKSPDAALPGVNELIAQGLGSCARSFEMQAVAYTRGLHTALLIRRFKKGLLRSA